MNSGFLKIIECFNITGFGFITEIQHNENGIPPGTQIIDINSAEIWIVKSRMLSGTLLIENSETYFECETKLDHLSNNFKTNKDREIAVKKEIEKRKKGIYWYLIHPKNKKRKGKPKIGSILKIQKAIIL